jgi:nucleotide-binding universal stress UspA family protein
MPQRGGCVARMLVAVDDSAGAREAVRHVTALAGDGLHVFAVVAHVCADSGSASTGRRGLEAGERLVAAAGAMLRAAGVSHEDEVRVADGDPAPVLIELARAHRCSAIIVGAGEPGLLRHLLLGSVARSLVAQSPVPVTVVRPRPRLAPPAPRRRSRDDGNAGRDSGWFSSVFGGWDIDGGGGSGDGGGGGGGGD